MRIEFFEYALVESMKLVLTDEAATSRIWNTAWGTQVQFLRALVQVLESGREVQSFTQQVTQDIMAKPTKLSIDLLGCLASHDAKSWNQTISWLKRLQAIRGTLEGL